ncbi:MAG: hypothetical protein DWG80_07135, partial [Chloroflexi bacterium]|nr:hypothetical protein [Chloroflexota bacterium]
MNTALPEPPADLGLDREVPLARHTYMRLGGPAAYFGVPEDLDQFGRIAAWARAQGLRLRVLGGGSNVCVADEGVRDV